MRRVPARRPVDLPEVSGRHGLVERFHDVRRRGAPPVFVIVGVRGSGKGQLLTYLRASYRDGRRYRWGEELDAILDFSGIPPERETGLVVLQDQLRHNASRWRRVRTPRFSLVGHRLWQHRQQTGRALVDRSALQADAEWMASAGFAVGKALLTGGPPLVKPSRRAGPVRWARVAWARHGPSAASRWARLCFDELPSNSLRGEHDEAIELQLERLLSKAIAEDLRVATKRRILPVTTVMVFVAAYDRVESKSTNARWLVELADDMAAVGARVMLVVAGRAEQLWSERLRSGMHRRIGRVELGRTVEIHPLDPLEPSERRYRLLHHGVPAELIEPFAEASQGHPLALNVLAMRFGHGRATTARQHERDLLRQLQALNESDIHEQEEWVGRFCAIIAPSLMVGFGKRLRRHVRAAAVLRTFDRTVLKAVMGSEFDATSFERLVETGLVDVPRPAPLLRSENAFRVQQFVREFWRQTADEAEQDWNRSALAVFVARADSEDDEQLQFELRVEALYHDLLVNGATAQARFYEALTAELQERRHSRSELLLDLVADLKTDLRSWCGHIEAYAGRQYLEGGADDLAIKHLNAAKALAEREPVLRDVRLRIAPALARHHRLHHRLDEALAEINVVLEDPEHDPVARFNATWLLTLIEKDRGQLAQADRLAEEALAEHAALLDATPKYEAAITDLGLHSFPRKRAHLLRHQADIARRAGRYGDCDALLRAAAEAYEADPEPKAEAVLRAIRADLLRLEGRTAEAEKLATQACDELAALSSDRHADLIARRSLAKARLAGADPESARAMLRDLAGVDSSAFPISAALGAYGLGEIDRLAGDYDEARKHYLAAIASSRHEHVIERMYARLGLVELERHAGDPHKAAPYLRIVERHGTTHYHGLLWFWTQLLRARLDRTSGLLLSAGDISRGLRAQHGGPGPHHAALEHTARALTEGGSFEPVHLLLP